MFTGNNSSVYNEFRNLISRRLDQSDMLDLNRLWKNAEPRARLLGVLLATYLSLFHVGPVNASQSPMARALYQTSPVATPVQDLVSPLATPTAVLAPLPAVTNGGSQTSLILVAIVLLGVLSIIALVMWRQK